MSMTPTIAEDTLSGARREHRRHEHHAEQHRANDHDERGNRDLEATAAVHEAARRPHVGQGAHLVGGVEDAD